MPRNGLTGCNGHCGRGKTFRSPINFLHCLLLGPNDGLQNMAPRRLIAAESRTPSLAKGELGMDDISKGIQAVERLIAPIDVNSEAGQLDNSKP